MPDNWPTVERHPEVCTRGFSGDFSACERVSYKIDSLGFIFYIQFYLLLLPRVVERTWSCLSLFYLAAVMHGARLVSKGVEKVRRQLEVADGGCPNRLKSQPASFLSFPASVIVCLGDKERQEWGKREQG